MRRLAAVVALLICTAACSGVSGGALSSGPVGAGQSFSLAILDESFLGEERTGSFDLVVEEAGDTVVVGIRASGVQELKALYCDLAYDPERWQPRSAEATGTLGEAGGLGPGDLLSLAVLSDPGVVHLGQMLPHPAEHQGFTGSAVLAQVRFEKGALRQVRKQSTAAQRPLAAPIAFGEWNGGGLAWYSVNPGDYDQNGVVGISDISPLGMNLGEKSEDGIEFDPATHFAAIDGDGNGEINIGDLTVIGRNFGNSILGGFHVYTSTYLRLPPPGEVEYEDLGELFAVVPFADTVTHDTSSQRRRYFFWDDRPLPDKYYFVRSADEEGNLGPPSDIVVRPFPMVPVDDYSIPQDEQAEYRGLARWLQDSNTLHWFYDNYADYDQNSTVNLADLTPLGAHFGDIGAFPYDSIGNVIDGDHNGEINISDLTPIRLFAHSSVNSYNIYMSLDPADYPVHNTEAPKIAPIAQVGFADALGQPNIERLWFEYTVENSEPGALYWVRPVFNGVDGTPSNLVEASAP
ncbi:hypothetical protein IIA79_01385 [bacterium]|nr:hypothetical protein [bacterium]